MSIFLVQCTLGIFLFFIINWIGKHSYSIGYVEISIFAKTEEAPALNFLIRVFTPLIYLIIISAGMYYLNLDKYVYNIYLVNIYYIIFRLLFNILTNRARLINWYRQSIYWVSIIIISIIAYEKLIKVKANILPDLTTIANEVWIIILIFLFQLTNNITISKDVSLKRKSNYLKSRYRYVKDLYGDIIKDITKNEILEVATYAILIYEDFNRPKVIRLVENIKQKLTKKQLTLGVMQVRSNNIITDKESVILGTTKIVSYFKNFWNENKEDSEGIEDSWILQDIISDYNGGESYGKEVVHLVELLKESFYSKTKDTLRLSDTLQTTKGDDAKLP